VRIPSENVFQPFPSHDRGIEYRESCPIVLETLATSGAPDGDEILRRLEVWTSGDGETNEPNISPIARIRERQYRRCRCTSVPSSVCRGKEISENLVSMSGSGVQFATRVLVVTVVRQDACFGVDSIRPVRIVHRRSEHDKLKRTHGPAISKTALIAQAEQPWKRVISGVASSSTLVDCINNQIGAGEIREGKCLHDRLCRLSS